MLFLYECTENRIELWKKPNWKNNYDSLYVLLADNVIVKGRKRKKFYFNVNVKLI